VNGEERRVSSEDMPLSDREASRAFDSSPVVADKSKYQA